MHVAWYFHGNVVIFMKVVCGFGRGGEASIRTLVGVVGRAAPSSDLDKNVVAAATASRL